MMVKSAEEMDLQHRAGECIDGDGRQLFSLYTPTDLVIELLSEPISVSNLHALTTSLEFVNMRPS